MTARELIALRGEYEAMTLVELLDLHRSIREAPPGFTVLVGAIWDRLPPLGGLVSHEGRHYTVLNGDSGPGFRVFSDPIVTAEEIDAAEAAKAERRRNGSGDGRPNSAAGAANTSGP